MSKLIIKFDDAKEVIKDCLEQFYSLKEETMENEFENNLEYLFQELEQKCFYPEVNFETPEKSEIKAMYCTHVKCKYKLPCGLCERLVISNG